MKIFILFFISAASFIRLHADEPDMDNKKVYKSGLPLVPGFTYLNADGTPGGFPAELLVHAARDENIKLEWISGSWTELFEKLKKGEIDLLTGTLITPERQKYLDYIDSYLYIMWSEIYIHQNTDFQGIESLNNQTIGLIRDDRNAQNFLEYIEGFGLNFASKIYDAHGKAYSDLNKGLIFAVPGPSKFFLDKPQSNIKSSGLFFKPTKLSIAFPKGKNKKIREQLTKRVKIYRNNPDSVLYSLKIKYKISDFNIPEKGISKILINIILIIIIAGIIIVIFLILLKKQVDIQTKSIAESEAKLKKSQETIALAIENACLGLWEYNMNDQNIKVSESWEKITALSPESGSIKLDEWMQYIHPEDKENTRRSLTEYLSRKTSRYESEYRYNHPDKGYIWIRSVGSNDSLEDSERMLGFIQDIDDYHQLVRQLAQAQKMESVGQLAGGIAHDFNNMLSGILGFAELLSKKLKDNPPLKECCNQIIQASERAEELISQLLTYARKGKQVHSPVDIHETINAAMRILARTIDKNIRIITDLKAKNHLIMGDQSLIQTAILNLGVNARDAMPEGGDFIVETENISLSDSYCNGSSFDLTPGNYLSIKISDSGKGISPELLPKIFDPFFTTKEIGKGTGLGLSVVHGTIISHKGAINIYSSNDKGTSFQIFLPLNKQKSPAIQTKQKPKNEELSFTGKKILIVDDERLIRAMADAILTDMGFKTILVENGSDALAILETEDEKIDFVLLDVMMPVMGGMDTLKKIRTINPHKKIIVVSGYTYQERIEDINDKNIIFLKKPFRAKELAATIEKLALI